MGLPRRPKLLARRQRRRLRQSENQVHQLKHVERQEEEQQQQEQQQHHHPPQQLLLQQPRPPRKKAKKEPPPREYSEFMECIDHATIVDWKTTGKLLGTSSDIDLNDEQKKLLYKEVPVTEKGEDEKEAATTKMDPVVSVGSDDSISFRKNWSNTNICSSRAAFARVRLAERKRLQQQQLQTGTKSSADMSNPVLTWSSEENAEQDKVLALLSEGCQTFVREILEKAIFCARQRQNIDGIRLWHEQHVKSKDDDDKKEPSPPPLSLRIGCDVSRQVARATGNATLTCKRMEEALVRQSGLPASARVLNEKTFKEVGSMSELAMRPKLLNGIDNADLSAKRTFEVYGGKHASEPPFGRLPPKKARLEVEDLIGGSNFGLNQGVHQATTTSQSLFPQLL
mmetsp:Transcript_12253/g.35557  ORF Transcript_12253/g.35557 Transcript_12253/m.35557 type:complete len:397 (-) Transcript_12253:26-1216(-)